jgi:two-component system, NarL family, response regulator LiaR
MAATTEPVRVLVVDDAEESRAILRRALAFDDAIEVVGEAASGIEAVRQAESLHPHVILMDVRMPEGDGVEATARITRRFPNVRVIALTAHDDQESVRDMLTAGAIGYLVKGASVDDLMAAIRQAGTGESLVDRRVLPHVLDELRSLLQQERQRRAEAERLARSREEFLQVLSHELRTPLTVIGGALQFVTAQPLGGDGRELVDAAMSRVEALRRMVEGLELIGQGPAGPAVRCDPRAEVGQALQGLERPDMVDVPKDDWAGVQPRHVGRVARELVSNALQHGERPVTLRAFRTDEVGVIEVRDRGDFVPDPDLFAPFVQADMSMKRERGGLGLGLFVVTRLCELNGGRLDLRREGAETVAEARFGLSS